jgi:hypothetical protein
MTESRTESLERSYPKELIIVERYEGGEAWHSVHKKISEVLSDIQNVGAKIFIGIYERKEIREISTELKQKVIKTRRG